MIMQATKNSTVFSEDMLTGLVLVEFAHFTDMVAEVASSHQVNHEVKVVPIFKSVLHINKEPKLIQSDCKLTGG